MTLENTIEHELMSLRNRAKYGAKNSAHGIAAYGQRFRAGYVLATDEVRNRNGGFVYVTTWTLDGKRIGYNALRNRLKQADAARASAALIIRGMNFAEDSRGNVLHVRTSSGRFSERFAYDVSATEAARKLRALAEKIETSAHAYATMQSSQRKE